MNTVLVALTAMSICSFTIFVQAVPAYAKTRVSESERQQSIRDDKLTSLISMALSDGDRQFTDEYTKVFKLKFTPQLEHYLFATAKKHDSEFVVAIDIHTNSRHIYGVNSVMVSDDMDTLNSVMTPKNSVYAGRKSIGSSHGNVLLRRLIIRAKLGDIIKLASLSPVHSVGQIETSDREAVQRIQSVFEFPARNDSICKKRI